MRKIVPSGNSGDMDTRIHPHSPDTTEDQPNSDKSDPSNQSDDGLIAAIRRSEARSREALFEQLGLITEAELRGIAENSGARSTQAWLRELLNLPDSDAKSRVVVARSTARNSDLSDATSEPELPATANILHTGEATIEHGRIITDAIAQLPPSASPAQRTETDTLLADYARTTSPRRLRTLADHLRYRWDQDGALQDEHYQLEHRELHLTTARDGTTRLNGRLDRETGAKLRAALEPLAAPHPDNGGTRDPRSAARRNADALDIMLSTTLAGDATTNGGTPPRITVTIDYDDLKERSRTAATPHSTTWSCCAATTTERSTPITGESTWSTATPSSPHQPQWTDHNAPESATGASTASSGRARPTGRSRDNPAPRRAVNQQPHDAATTRTTTRRPRSQNTAPRSTRARPAKPQPANHAMPPPRPDPSTTLPNRH